MANIFTVARHITKDRRLCLYHTQYPNNLKLVAWSLQLKARMSFNNKIRMFLFNETIGIDKDIEANWLEYIKGTHVPMVMKTGLFEACKIYKVLHDQEDGSVSYSIQYFAKSIEHVNQYLDVFAPKLIEQHRQRYHNKHVTFRTLLEEV